MKTGRYILLLVAIQVLLAGTLAACTPGQDSVSTSSHVIAAPAYDQRLDGLMIDGSPAAQTTKTALSNQQEPYTGNIQPEYQLPELPSGCEVISLTMVLRAMGFDLTKTEIADNYLVVNGSEWGFLASPYDENGGGFPPGIVNAANAYLEGQSTLLRAHNITGSSFDALCALVDAGIPVCVWTTLRFDEPNYDASLGGTDTWFVNEHCVVFFGNVGMEVKLANPLEGIQAVERQQFAEAYDLCGKMALAIY